MMHVTHDYLHLPDSTLDDLGITPSEAADAIEEVLAAKAEGRFHTAPKTAIMPGGGRYMMSTLSVGDDGLTSLKTVSVSPDNAARGLAASNGAILVLDAETGLLRAVLGANWVTAVRTAALSTVAARRLADPASKSVGFIGCGVQARSHLETFAEMFPLRRIFAYGRGSANRDRLMSAAEAMGLEAMAAETPEAALSASDLIVTSITLDYSVKPFLDASWLKPNAFAAITDLAIPWKDDSIGAFGTIVVDDLEQEKEAERPMVPPEVIAGDLTGLASGSLRVPEDGKPSAFVFRGIALGDYAVAALAYKRAEMEGKGLRILP